MVPTPPVDAPLTTNVTNIKVHMTILHGFPVSSLFQSPQPPAAPLASTTYLRMSWIAGKFWLHSAQSFEKCYSLRQTYLFDRNVLIRGRW